MSEGALAIGSKARTVNTSKPWLLVTLVDGSHSMSADWVGTKRSMAEIVEQSVNNMLYDMALHYSISEGEGEDVLKDRIHLRLLTYSGEDDVSDPIPLPGGSYYLHADGEDGWVKNYSELHRYNGSQAEIPRWFKHVPNGKTPMLKAFQTARRVIEEHISQFPDSFPPVLLNISDGEPSDCGEPIDWSLLTSECEAIRSLGRDGNHPIICNVHLDPRGRGLPSLYPEKPPSENGIEDGLWRSSSKISDLIGFQKNHSIPEVARDGNGDRRFFVFNSDLMHFHEFLSFSTRLGTNIVSALPYHEDFTEEE